VTTFEVWAPTADQVDVVVGPEGGENHVTPLRRRPGGWWSEEVPQARHGDDYAFVLHADGTASEPLKDPRSPWQPNGTHGRSRVYDDALFGWSDASWRGLPLAGSVLYEMHIGTFTPGGTFDAAIERLEHLVSLGVDAVEVMPVNGFNGERGWGYDGVDLYAVHEPYGGPDGLKRFVDACHARNLGVVLDVVYNHLGPSGNVLGRYGPYLTSKHQTPWGEAVNLDDELADDVRTFIVGNACRWLRDFHIDGLRLDAVQALKDDSALHLLEQLSQAVRTLSASSGRPLFLVAESDLNAPRLIRGSDTGGLGLDGMWADDLHHAVHSALTGERDGYYVDFGPLAEIGTAWSHGYVYRGRHSAYRKRTVGRPLPSGTPGWQIVVALQNHDQVGNRATGDRLSASLSDGLLKVGAAMVLLAPMTPLLFMGEEWGARTPWRYFTAHPEPELAEAVRHGRRSEFAAFGWNPADVPDPQDPETMASSVLDWRERDDDRGRDLLGWYRELLHLRRTVTALGDGRLDLVHATSSEDDRWLVLRRGEPGDAVALVVNLSAVRQVVPVGAPVSAVLAASAPGFGYGPGSVELDGESALLVRLVAKP
jgi:maltooligosyltrehalose trehalohydrolase